MNGRSIITHIPNINTFYDYLVNNQGIIIVKFGAEWCQPCKRIDKLVHDSMFFMPDNVQNMILNIDESFELYAYLKNKKMVNGIPALLCFYKGNHTFIPDDSVSGADASQINAFFTRCYIKVTH